MPTKINLERFFALSSGGCLALDDSCGKDIDQLFRNFSEIKPHVYFSVPKVYQEIISKTLTSKAAESTFFHQDLKFVFTAAAPLPMSISDIFKTKKVPVVEGWGLTETSPCCTLTGFSLDRSPGIVGFPIPGVEIKLTDENEICVKGPNVMQGYFKEEAKTKEALTEGWFKTGDLGEITEQGLKIISRKDRVFKLSNAEKVFPSAIEENMKDRCKYIKHVYVFGSGKARPFALIFPNTALLSSEKIGSLDETDCQFPRSSSALASCLQKCLHQLNCNWPTKYERIERALVIHEELSLEQEELTPSFKMVPRKVEKRFHHYIECVVSGALNHLPQNAYVVELVRS